MVVEKRGKIQTLLELSQAILVSQFAASALVSKFSSSCQVSIPEANHQLQAYDSRDEDEELDCASSDSCDCVFIYANG